MSDLRTAALRALEALEDTSPLGFNMESDKKFFAAITALRAALAEPGSDYERGFVDGMLEQARRSVDKAVNAMAEPFSPEAISITQTAWKMGYEARKAEEQADPEPPPEAQTEAEKIAYCAGWWAALEKARTAEPVEWSHINGTSDTKWHPPQRKPVAWDGNCVLGHCNSPAGCENSGECRAGATQPQRPAAPIIKPEIKEDNSVPQAQQFLFNAWADEQIQKEKK